METDDTSNRYIKVSLMASEKQPLTLRDVSLFLYDFTTLYEIGRLATDSKYSNFQFTRFVLYRNNNRLQSQDEMYVERIRLESPLEVIVVVAAASGAAIGAVWAIVQIVEKIYNMPLNRQKLELEVRKLEREELVANKGNNIIISPDEAAKLLYEREALPYLETVERRLARSPFQVEKFDIDVIDLEVDSVEKEGFHRWLRRR